MNGKNQYGPSSYKLIHSYNHVEEIIRLVWEGKYGIHRQYLLNPSLSSYDIWFTLLMLVILVLLRFLLSGIQHESFKGHSSVFRFLFGKYSKPKKEIKLCENLWYSVWHTFSFCFGLYVLYKESLGADNPGWPRLLFKEFDVKWYWFPTPAEMKLGNLGWPLFPVSLLLRTYYLTELAFWISCGIYLALETIRDDFYALMLHHTITCSLILFSYTCSFWRIGTIILVTHDLADIILYTTKTVHYTRSPDIYVDILFVFFAFGFFMSRLIFFPLFCVRPVLELSNFQEWTDGVIKSHWQIPGGVTLPTALCVLQMLHLFWFGLILKMIFKAIREKKVSEAGDIRSDDEESKKAETSEDEEPDQRMRLSSLPGVRATLTKRELRPRQNIQNKNK